MDGWCYEVNCQNNKKSVKDEVVTTSVFQEKEIGLRKK